MGYFPLSTPISNDNVIKITCKLYRQSLVKILPISIALVALYAFVRFGIYLYPPKFAHLHSQIGIFAVVLFLPITGTLFYALDLIGKSAPFSYSKVIIYTIQRFLALAGCFFSMLLLPVIILGACAGVYFYLGMNDINMLIIFGWAGISALLVFAFCIPKVFAPILVFSDMLGANESIDESARLVKGNFARSMMFCLLAGLILFFCASISYLLISYFPTLKAMPQILMEGIAIVLLAFIGPWCFALLLTLKYDLQMSHPLMASQPQKIEKPNRQPPPMSVQNQTKNDEDKFNF